MQAIGAPLVFMLLLFILQQADYAKQSVTIRNPPSALLDGLFGCDGPLPCINIMFAPNNDTYKSYLRSFAKKNALRTGQPEFRIEEQLNGTKFLTQIIPYPQKILVWFQLKAARFCIIMS